MDELSGIEQKVNLCRETLEKFSSVFTAKTLGFEIIDIRCMVQKLELVNENVKELEETLQVSGKRTYVRRTNSTAESIIELVYIVRGISSRLNDINEKLKAFAERNDVFRPDLSSIPKMRVPAFLNFSTRDTMEGEVKARVLDESVERPSRNTGNIHAHVTAVVGIAGMGGIGKTTALIGLAQDADVQEKFSDGGIYFLVVGKDATPGKLVASLKEMVRCSGGKRLCEEMDCNVSLESAVSITSSWFAKRRALFICDDLWKTSSCQTGYFNSLVGLLDESPDSHLLISTRSSVIASETKATIVFKPRSTTGHEARGIFLCNAALDEGTIRESGFEELVNQVLERCSGVPLMLSIAGAHVRRRSGTTKASLNGLIYSLAGNHLSLQEEQRGQYPTCFNEVLEGSLKTAGDVLETSRKFMKPWNEYCSNMTQPAGTVAGFVSDCFERLCVLPRSARVSEEILFGIWCINSKELGWNVIDSLVDFHLLQEFKDAQGNPNFGLHDVVLDYCVKASQTGQNAKYELYHRAFLSQAWELCHGGSSSAIHTDGTWGDCNRAMDAFWNPDVCKLCRPWWKTLSIVEKIPGIRNYLLGNLVWHLKEAARLSEAVGLLSHMGWTKLRVVHGGISAVSADFSLVESAIRSYSGGEQNQEARVLAHSGIKTIWDMFRKTWPIILKNPESLPTHALGYLMNDGYQPPLVQRYLHSTNGFQSGPWLKPRNAFWRILDMSSNGRVFRSADRIIGIFLLTESREIIAATRRMLFWIDYETMTVTREKLIRHEGGNSSRISAFAVCEAKGILVLGFSNGDLQLRNDRNGNMLRRILGKHEGSVTSVAINTDGRKVVSGSDDTTVRLWDAETGIAVGVPLRGHNSFVGSVGISGDGRTIVSGSDDDTVRVWDSESGRAVGEPLRGHKDWVTCVGISTDGRTVVSGSDDNTVRVWDAETGTAVCEPLRGFGSDVNCVAISADGQTVVSGCTDATMQVWDLESGAAVEGSLLKYDSMVECVSMSMDGLTIVSGSRDGTVRVWEAQSGATVEDTLLGHDTQVSCASMSADGRTAVSGSEDGKVRVWDVESGVALSEELLDDERMVYNVCMSADGRRIVSGSWECTIRLWDAVSGTPLCEPLLGHEDTVTSVSISTDNRTVVSGSWDNTLRVWDLETSTAVGGPLIGHEDTVTSVCLSADGRTVVSGSDDRTVRVWDLKSGKAVGEPLRGHIHMVTCVGISTDGRTVVSGSCDKTVLVWDLETGTAVCEPLRGHGSFVDSVAISADGRTVVSGCESTRTIWIWNRSESELHWKCSYTCLLPVAWRGVLAYRDKDGSSGVIGKLYCPIGRGGASRAVFEVIRPG